MRTIKRLTIFLFAAFASLSCLSQSGVVLNYLPPDTKMIVKINPASMGLKIKWDSVLKSKMFEDILSKAPQAKNLLSNPAQTGVR